MFSKQLYIGTSTWSQSDWVGNYYPPNAKPADYLVHYTKGFRTVEVDSTFYAIPRPQIVQGWYSKTPSDFRFCAKLPQRITHEKLLLDVKDDLLHFLNVISELREKLLAILIQFPPSFAASLETVEEMKAFLFQLPPSIRFSLEVRHPSWLREKFYERLSKHNVALTLTDQPAMNQMGEPLWVETADFLYLRWLGNRKLIHEPFNKVVLNKDADLRQWAQKVKATKIQTVMGYFNNHFSGHSPTSAKEFISYLESPE
ncbi:MAG: DUF72 domain-containing protein [Chloroherpetonaceae bacterium]|nr:DUF72 domain-containing protein [Chloroherpetonaceae bacterium]